MFSYPTIIEIFVDFFLILFVYDSNFALIKIGLYFHPTQVLSMATIMVSLDSRSTFSTMLWVQAEYFDPTCYLVFYL
jgi:hypothetical protein